MTEPPGPTLQVASNATRLPGRARRRQLLDAALRFRRARLPRHLNEAPNLPYHHGRTEGVNSIKAKMIKRQMYGAGFTRLRHRVLLG